MDNIKKMYIVSFLSGMMFFGPIAIPFFLDWGHLDYTRIFLLEAAFMLSTIIFQMPTGVFADKYGRRTSILIGQLLSAAMLLVLVLKPDFYAFLVAEVIGGMGVAFAYGADRALVFDTLKEMKREKTAKEVFARLNIANLIGFIVVVPIGSAIAGSSILPYPEVLRLPFFLTILPCLAAALATLTLAEPRRSKSALSFLQAAIKGIEPLRKNLYLRTLALDMAVVSITSFFMFWFYQSILRNAGVDIVLFGIVSAAFNAVSVLVMWKVAQIERFAGTGRLLFLSALIIGAAYLVLGLSSALWLGVIGIFAVTALRTLRQPVFEHYINFHIKSGERAAVLSSIGMLERFGIMIMYPIVGFLTDISLQLAFLVLGAITLIFAFLLRSDEEAFEKGRQ